MVEHCPYCRTRVMYSGDFCPSCRISKLDGSTQAGFRTRAINTAGSRQADVVAAQSTDFSTLAVSDEWKQVFSLIEKAGGPQFRNRGALTFGERMRVGTNLLAFMFGPFYYAAKGMWQKGITLLLAGIAIAFVIEMACAMLKINLPSQALGAAISGMFSSQANMDFYKKQVLGKSGWLY